MEGFPLDGEECFRALFEQSPMAIAISVAGRTRYVNPAYLELFGFGCAAEILGASLGEQIAPHCRAEILARNARRESGESMPRSYETVGLRKDGTTFPFRAEVAHVELGGERVTLVFIADITAIRCAEEERRILETQMQHAQKLESLGVLAGGIAHDFNNILMTILGNADLALMDLREGCRAAESIEEIIAAGHRAADLCRQMQAYSGTGQFHLEPLDLSAVVEEIAPMLASSIAKRVVLEYELDRDLPPVQADSAQLHQVILNLVTNAAESVEARSDHAAGRVLIRTSSVESAPEDVVGCFAAVWRAAGPYALLEIVDDGCGMDGETQAKIFEPFFSTKFAGRGLGLSAVHGIVRRHGGAIRVQSEAGEGSALEVFLPAAGATCPEAPCERADIPSKRLEEGATVLLVDDEPAVAQIGARMLRKLGLRPLLASSGREAIDCFRVHRAEISCVLLDLSMPEMSGDECLLELRRLQPTVAVILASGYERREIAARFDGAPPAGFLHKPFELGALQAALQTALAGGP